jgi:hypothetical protein
MAGCSRSSSRWGQAGGRAIDQKEKSRAIVRNVGGWNAGLGNPAYNWGAFARPNFDAYASKFGHGPFSRGAFKVGLALDSEMVGAGTCREWANSRRSVDFAEWQISRGIPVIQPFQGWGFDFVWG